MYLSGTYCTVPYFGFKAKPESVHHGTFFIVLCLILDSRQNRCPGVDVLFHIVLCLILDSRQNHYGYVPVAWLIVLCLILDSRQN